MFAASPHAEVVAVCDVDDAMFAKPVKAVEAATGKRPRPRKTFTACSMTRRSTRSQIALPTIGMLLLTVRACQANKDVYVEKPASHDVVEGRRMVEAAQVRSRKAQCRHRNRPSEHPAVPAGQHRSSHRQEIDLRRRHRVFSRRGGGRAAAHRIQQPVRDAVARLNTKTQPESRIAANRAATNHATQPDRPVRQRAGYPGALARPRGA